MTVGIFFRERLGVITSGEISCGYFQKKIFDLLAHGSPRLDLLLMDKSNIFIC